MDNKLYISWDETSQDTKELVNLIRWKITNYKLENIYLLIPCRWWEIIWSLVKNSLWLHEKQVYRVKFSNLKYDTWEEKVIIKSEEDKSTFSDLQSEVFCDKEKLVIFIDDLVDSWHTLNHIKLIFQLNNINLLSWVLYSKEGKNKHCVDLCVKDLEDKWIVFPWEEFYEK